MNTSSGIWELLTGGFVAAWQSFYTWLAAVWNSGADISVLWILLCIIIFSIYLASGFFAASVAESRGRKPFFHFLTGLIIPFLYPLSIFFFLKPSFGDEIMHQTDAAKSEAPKLVPKHAGLQFKEKNMPESSATESSDSAGQNLPESSEPSATVAVSDIKLDENAEINMAYFTSIAMNSDGSAAGPFLFELADSSVIEVHRILNPMEQLSVVEIPGAKTGEPPRSIRIPYARIKSIRLK